MSEPKLKKVWVEASWENLPYIGQELPPSTYRDLLEDALTKVPDEYRASAKVAILTDGSSEGGAERLQFGASYFRPETPSEASERVRKKGLRDAQTRESEIKMLRELKEKYPDI
jgi:hypothetical protein